MNSLFLIHGLLGPLEGVLPPPPISLRLDVRYARLPGYGSLETRPPDDLTLDSQARAVLAQLSVGTSAPAWLLGHSVGGAIALRVAALAPERVAGVISVEGNFTLADAFWCRHIAGLEPDAWRREHAAMIADAGAWLARAGMAETSQNLANARRTLSFQSAETLRAVARAVVADTGTPAFLEDARRSVARGLPLHLIAGERSASDWHVPGWAREMAGSSRLVGGVGHMLPIEDPTAFWLSTRDALAAADTQHG